MKKAQGTIEYLVILAIIVVVSLIVVSLLLNSTTQAQGTTQGIEQLATSTAQLALSEALINEDGNYFLKIKNNTGNNATIQDIKIGDNTITGLDKIVGISSEEAFSLNLLDYCIEG